MKTVQLTEFLDLIYESINIGLEVEDKDISEEILEKLVSKMPNHESIWVLNQIGIKRQQLHRLIELINKYRQK